jgi:hypothetical protein
MESVSCAGTEPPEAICSPGAAILECLVKGQFRLLKLAMYVHSPLASEYEAKSDFW